jgi:branched-chain amino acid transport system substrate-binding protein
MNLFRRFILRRFIFRRFVRTAAVLTGSVVLVAGCSAPAPAAAPTTAPSAATAVPKASTAAPAPTTAPAAPPAAPASTKPIRIGMSLPLTGPTAYLGESAVKAVQMGMDDWNARGGVNGRKFELVTGDNAGQPQQGVTVSRKLIDVDKVSIVLGQLNSSVTLAAMPVFLEKQIPSIAYVDTNRKIYDSMGSGGNPWVFRINADDSMMADAFASQLAQEAKSYAIVAQGDDFGRGAASLYEPRLKKAGVTVTSTSYYDIGTADFRPVLSKIQSENPEALLLVMLANDGAVFMRGYGELGLKQKIYSRGALVSKEFLDRVKDNPKLAEGIVEATVWTSGQDPETESAYEKRYNEPPVIHGVMAYYAFQTAAQAFKANGGDDSPAAVQGALKKLDFQQPGLGHISFDEHDQAYPNMSLATWKDGKIVLLKTIPTK